MKEHGFIVGIYVLLLGPFARSLLDGPRGIGMRPIVEDLFLVAAASVAAAFVASLVFIKLLNALELEKGKRPTNKQRDAVISRSVLYIVVAVFGVAVPFIMQKLGVVSYETAALYIVALLVVSFSGAFLAMLVKQLAGLRR